MLLLPAACPSLVTANGLRDGWVTQSADHGHIERLMNQRFRGPCSESAEDSSLASAETRSLHQLTQSTTQVALKRWALSERSSLRRGHSAAPCWGVDHERGCVVTGRHMRLGKDRRGREPVHLPSKVRQGNLVNKCRSGGWTSAPGALLWQERGVHTRRKGTWHR